MTEEISDVKARLRSDVRSARRARSATRRTEAAIAIATHVLAIPAVQEATCVSVYASRPTEPGTLPLLEALADHGKRVLLPVLGDGLERGWAPYVPDEKLVKRAPGRPPEPSSGFVEAEALQEADVVCVPALGVDDQGTRLGQGGGWYDRALTYASPHARIVALCFDEELHAEGEPLPREEHDIPVHAVVTPHGYQEFVPASRT